MKKRFLAMVCAALLAVSSVPEGVMTVYAAKAETEAAAEDVNVALAITAQPQDVTTGSGKTVTFSVTAVGDGLKYQWQVKSDASSEWKNTTVTGAKTATVSVAADASKSGRQYRCVVKDGKGTSVESDAATLTVVSAPKIETQPANVTTSAGKKASFSVTASGTGLKYQWQVKNDDASAWKNTTVTGATTATVTVTADVSKSGRKYRCVVTDKYGQSVKSNSAVLTVVAAPKISKQPANVTIAPGKTATFSVTASGTGLKYQWQVKNDDASAWKNTTVTGATTSTVSVATDLNKSGRKYRCVITDKYGQSVKSEAAILTVKAAPKITTQPSNVKKDLGKTASFTVKAENATGYQWQQSADGTNWSNIANGDVFSGAKTKTLSFTVTQDLEQYQYRCVVKSDVGNVNSKAVTVTWTVPAPKITNTAVHPNEVYLEWTEVPGAIYQMYVAKVGATLTLHTRGIDRTSYSIIKLDGNTKYQFAVKAIVDGRESALGEAVTVDVPGGTELSYAEQVIELVNAERAKVGAQPLKMTTQMQAAALKRAQELEVLFSHTRPDGTMCDTIFAEFSISTGWWGENIASGYRTPEAVVAGWMGSEGHRENMLNPGFKTIGVGYYEGADGKRYWVQLFNERD